MKLIYRQDNGDVAVVWPARKKDLEAQFGPMTDRAYMTHLVSRSIPPGKAFKVIEDTAIPTDRVFRDAWSFDPQEAIVVDMEKARTIHMNRLRLLRASQFKALDEQAMRAMEVGDTETLKQVVDLKQQLRDMPQTENLQVYTTPDTLKDYKPDYLEGDIQEVNKLAPK